MIGLFLYLSVRSAAPRANATAWIRLSSPSPDSSPLVTPEALKPVAPGWRGSAYPGLGRLKESHPEGGAKAPFSYPPPGLGIHFAGSPVSLRDPVSAGRNDGVLQKWSPRPSTSTALRAEYAYEYAGGHLETGLWQLAPGLW